MTRRLIVISGDSCTGKTSVGEALWELFTNASCIDADRLWWVREPARPGEGLPFFLDAVSHLISNQFAFGIDTVILSWWFPKIGLIDEIADKVEHEHVLSHFMLTAEEATRLERYRLRGDDRPYQTWAKTDLHGRLPCTVEVSTEGISIAEAAEEIRKQL